MFDIASDFLKTQFRATFFVPFDLVTKSNLLSAVGQPAAPSEGATALCQASQAEPSSVPGPARAATPGHQHHVPSGLL